MKQAQETISRQHEGFETQESPRTIKKIIRQDRIPVYPGKAFIAVNGERFEIQNYSKFGLAITASPLAKLTEEQILHDAKFEYQGYEIGSYSVRVVRKVNDTPESISVGLETINEPIDTHVIEAVELLHKIFADQNNDISLDQNIPADFKAKVFELRDWFETLKANCDAAESELNWESADISKLRDTIASLVGNRLLTELQKSYRELGDTLQKMNKDDIKKCVAFFRKKLKHIIYRSPLADRAFKKPLGYAGDFQMMNIVYENSHAGLDLFTKCIHQYFAQENATKAVWNRSIYLKDKIEAVVKNSAADTIRILSVACGPAKEIEYFLEKFTPNNEKTIEFHLIDQDITALQNAQMKLQTLIRKNKLDNVKVFYHNIAIKNIIVRGLSIGSFQLVYSAGLFDYFSDPVAVMTAEKLFAALANHGQLIIGNFDIINPSQRMMELVMDWELIYRSKEDLNKLYGHLDASVTVEQEPEKINLFAVIRKSNS